jgi:hypothetical protein
MLHSHSVWFGSKAFFLRFGACNQYRSILQKLVHASQEICGQRETKPWMSIQSLVFLAQDPTGDLVVQLLENGVTPNSQATPTPTRRLRYKTLN